MTSFWQTAIAAVLGLAALEWAAVSLAMARQSRAVREELARRVEGLSSRLRTIEASVGNCDSPTVIQSPRARNGSPPILPRARIRRLHRIDQPAPTAGRGPTLIAVPSMVAVGSGDVAQEAATALSQHHAEIWNLADAGQLAQAISLATGRPIGQVELILALRKQAGSGRRVESRFGQAVGNG